MKQIKSLISLSIAVLLMIGIIFPVVLSADGDIPEKIPANEWMKYIADSAYVNSMNIPGTHDSGMYYCDDWTSSYAITQNTDVAGQLEAGARIFDIRLRYSGNNTAMICHGPGSALRYDAQIPAATEDDEDTYYYYETVLKQIADFLIAHPSETVIITVQHEHDADDEVDYDSEGEPDDSRNIYTAMEAAEKKLETWLKDENDPTLSHIIRIWKVERYKVNRTLGSARGKVFIFEYGTGFGDLMPDARNKYEYTFAEKWNVLFPYFNEAPVQNIEEFKDEKNFRAAYTSCTGQKALNRKGETVYNNVGVPFFDSWIIPTPDKEGKSMRKLLLAYNFKKGAYYGWVSMDFLDEDLARKIFDSNTFKGEPNRIAEQPQTYISDIKGFLDGDYDDALEECLNQGYQVLVGKKSSGGIYRDMNPDGDPIIIGYKTTTNPNNAIRDIVGTYDDDDGPSGYTMVEVSGSYFDYFTRLSGWSSEYTYLFYSKKGNKAPITELEMLDTQRGKEMVKLVKTNTNFNLQEGLDRYCGIAVTRSAASSYSGSTISEGTLAMILGILLLVIAAYAVVVTVMFVKNRKKTDN